MSNADKQNNNNNSNNNKSSVHAAPAAAAISVDNDNATIRSLDTTPSTSMEKLNEQNVTRSLSASPISSANVSNASSMELISESEIINVAELIKSMDLMNVEDNTDDDQDDEFVQNLKKQGSWVRLDARVAADSVQSPGRITPDTLAESKHLALLEEAQRDSRESSRGTSKSGSQRASSGGTPKSPPNSPTAERKTNTSSGRDIYINYLDYEDGEGGKNEMGGGKEAAGHVAKNDATTVTNGNEIQENNGNVAAAAAVSVLALAAANPTEAVVDEQNDDSGFCIVGEPGNKKLEQQTSSSFATKIQMPCVEASTQTILLDKTNKTETENELKIYHSVFAGRVAELMGCQEELKRSKAEAAEKECAENQKKIKLKKTVVFNESLNCTAGRRASNSKPMTVYGFSMRNFRIGDHSIFSRDILYTFVMSNLTSLALGIGVGIIVAKRMIMLARY